VVSAKTAESGQLELKSRTASEARMVSYDTAIAELTR